MMPQSMETGSFHVRMRFMMRCRMVVCCFLGGAGCPELPDYPDGPDVLDCPDVLDGPDCPEVPGPPDNPDAPEDTTLWFIKKLRSMGPVRASGRSVSCSGALGFQFVAVIPL